VGVVKRFLQGIFSENPVLFLMIGLVPAIGVTHLAVNGLFVGITTTAVVLAALIVGLILTKVVPNEAQSFLYLALLAIFTTLAHRILVVAYPEIVVGLGMYFPLMVVYGFGLLKASLVNNPIESVAKGLGTGIGFTIILTLVGVIREFLGAGEIFGKTILELDMQIFSLASTVPGGFVILGLLMALINAITKKGGEING
jgi:electron transport complex protein RnfE